MKTSSAKAKGRNLQKWVRDELLTLADNLSSDDIRSTSMGASGVDIQLSQAGKIIWPFAIECKNLNRVAAYQWYDQAKSNAGKEIPIVVAKQNHSDPIVICDAKWFFEAFKQYGVASKGY